MTSALLFANNAETTLASASITVGDTSITVTSATGFPAANSGTGDYFYAIMYELTGAVETKVEIVKVTNLAGTSWTVLRGAESTTVYSRDTAVKTVYIENRFTAAAATLALQSARNLADLVTPATARTNLGLGSVENTAVSTWVGTTNITTLGTIGTGSWNATVIPDGKIASTLTGKTYNALSLTALATGFSIAGGSTSKTLTLSNTLTLAGTDASTLNIGAGGTLGTAAFTATTAYAPAIGSVSITTLGTIGTGVWQGTAVTVPYGGTGVATLAGLVKGNGAAAFSAATVRTDYAEPTNALASGLLYNTTTSGAHSIATAIQIGTAIGISGLLKGNGAAAITAASVGTDYQAPIGTISGIAKGNGANALTAAAAGTDFLAPASTHYIGTELLAFNRASGAQTLAGVSISGSAGTAGSATSATTASNLAGGDSTLNLGALPFQSNTNVTSLLTPNRTATKMFLQQTGTGVNGASPAWGALIAGDVPTLNQNTTGSSASCTGNAATVTTNANLTGEVTSAGNATTVTNAAVIGKLITGYVSGSGVVAATDTILQAINKLNGNDALKVTSGGALGTPTSGTLTSCSGLPAAGVTGTALVSAAIGTTVQAYDVDTAKLDVAQTFTAPQRGTITTDNDGSFDLNATNNFKCTTAGALALTFTNIPAATASQSGSILFINGGNHAITAAATTKVASGTLAAISVTGTYLLGYFSDGTNVYVAATGALA